MVTGTAIKMNPSNGGRAKAPVAPDRKAMARRRHPQERMAPWGSAARTPAREETLATSVKTKVPDLDKRPRFFGNSLAFSIG
jgi:hypothetical protein